jgi:hypothetical protein
VEVATGWRYRAKFIGMKESSHADSGWSVEGPRRSIRPK